MTKSEPDPVAAVELALIGAPGGARRLPRPPAHLSTEARAWWRSVVGTFDLAPHHLANLEGAAVALDRAREARQRIDADGLSDLDRFGQTREHPLANAERQYLLVHARLVRECGLDLQAVPVPRKPTRWK